MSNHPNRSKYSYSAPRNPTPEEIKAARENIGLSQAQAADLIYCTPRAWEDWEAGNRRMHPAFWDLWTRKTNEVRQ